MTRVVTLEDALEIVKQLSPLDKLRLIEKVTPDIKEQLAVTTHQPHKSLRGLWRGSNISDADIADVKQQIGANFPREDIGSPLNCVENGS